MACIGFTATVSVNDGASNASVAFDEVVQITLPSRDTTIVETSFMGMSSPDKTYVGGLSDNGNLAIEMNWTKVTYNRLNALLGKARYGTRIPSTGSAAVSWVVTSPDEDGPGANTAQIFTFGGILSKLDLSFDTEGIAKIKCDIKVTGAITLS